MIAVDEHAIASNDDRRQLIERVLAACGYTARARCRRPAVLGTIGPDGRRMLGRCGIVHKPWVG
jgi:hypothetical protein